MKGAGVLLFARSSGRVLLLLRPDGTWNVPGGGIEPGETPRVAAIRELREETGVKTVVMVTPAPIALLSERGRRVDLASPLPGSSPPTFAIFGGTVASEFQAQLDGENLASGWFDPGALPIPLHPGVDALTV